MNEWDKIISIFASVGKWFSVHELNLINLFNEINIH
jgi:hypothetical protein